MYKRIYLATIITAIFASSAMPAAYPRETKFRQFADSEISLAPHTTTWFPKDFTCPIDNQKNTFMVWGSYGSYIYSWPSKYQWLFWPLTDTPAFYICKKCHLATFMDDFDHLPKGKLPEIKKILSNIAVSKPFKDYKEIPVSERLEIIEKVYAVLDRDEEWWEQFHRLKGYHYAMESNAGKALNERKKSLEMLAGLLIKEKTETPKKLLLYMSGAMKHFTKDDVGALADFEAALKTKYEEKDLTPEKIKDADEGINSRIEDYIKRIKSDNPPRLMDTKHDYN